MKTPHSSPFQRQRARVLAERKRINRDFHEAVNMTASRLQAWLETDESNEVGWRRAPGEESIGHQSGRRIVEILKTPRRSRTADDLLHMRTVVGYVRRHLAQRPFKNVSTSRWAYSLKNWGHDPGLDFTSAR